MKRVLHVILLVAWFLGANHCVMAVAFAEARPKNSDHSHCGGHKESKEKKSHESKPCDKSGCCQPLIKPLEESTSVKVTLPTEVFPVNILLPSVSSIPESETLRTLPPTHGPPALHQALLYSLKTAPNAPPIS